MLPGPCTYNLPPVQASESTKAHTKGSVLQCVAVCCSVLQCVAVCCSVNEYECKSNKAHTKGSVLQCVAVHCGELQCEKSVSASRPRHTQTVDILKHQLATELPICSHYTADLSLRVRVCCVVFCVCVDVWMLHVVGIDILKRQLAAELAICNHHRADLSLRVRVCCVVNGVGVGVGVWMLCVVGIDVLKHQFAGYVL